MSRVVDALDGGALRLLVPVLAAGARLRLPLSNEKAKRELGWRPAYPTPGSALEHAARELAGTDRGREHQEGRR